jgi:hypothetical protein
MTADAVAIWTKEMGCASSNFRIALTAMRVGVIWGSSVRPQGSKKVYECAREAIRTGARLEQQLRDKIGAEEDSIEELDI